LKQLLGVSKATSGGATLILCNIEPMVCRWRKVMDRYLDSRRDIDYLHPIHLVKISATKSCHWTKINNCRAENSKKTALQTLQDIQEKTKAAMKLDLIDKPHPVLQAPKQYRWLLVNAALGNLARQPATCTKCRAEKTGLNHAYRCLDIHAKYGFHPETDPLELLFKRRVEQGSNGPSTSQATEIAKAIWTECLGRQDPAHC